MLTYQLKAICRLNEHFFSIYRFLGDGVLAVFDAPITHENDPEQSVLAAQKIRNRATELGLRVTSGIMTLLTPALYSRAGSISKAMWFLTCGTRSSSAIPKKTKSSSGF
ncbi:MAG: hypothetical protein CMN78_01650 [Spirochaetales bacterium]|nr:hypothetical protein [Spirochaetales bacterium]